jgi:hypothetical protein
MSVGLQVRNASSQPVFTLDDTTLLQVDFFPVLEGQSVTKSFSFLPAGVTISTAIVFVNQPPLDEQFVLPTVSVSGTTVTVTGINSSGSTTVSGTYTIQSGTVYVLVFAK